jgi:hypothetical protein
MAPCEVCLDLRLHHASPLEGRNWRVRVKDDLTLEYLLQFASHDLKRLSEAGCGTCWIVKEGLSRISVNLHLFDDTGPYQGRFILQDDCPLEVEVFGEQAVKSDKSFSLRIQYYSLQGLRAPLIVECFKAHAIDR